MLKNCKIPSRIDSVEQRSRDPYDYPITTDDHWVSIPFSMVDSSSDWDLKNEAESWAKDQFGNGFFRFGSKFFFADESMLVQFKLRWL